MADITQRLALKDVQNEQWRQMLGEKDDLIRQLYAESEALRTDIHSRALQTHSSDQVQVVRAIQHWTNSQQVSSLVAGPTSTATRWRPRAITRQPHREADMAPTSPDPISAYYRRLHLSPQLHLLLLEFFHPFDLSAQFRDSRVTCSTISIIAFSSSGSAACSNLTTECETHTVGTDSSRSDYFRAKPCRSDTKSVVHSNGPASKSPNEQEREIRDRSGSNRDIDRSQEDGLTGFQRSYRIRYQYASSGPAHQPSVPIRPIPQTVAATIVSHQDSFMTTNDSTEVLRMDKDLHVKLLSTRSRRS